jgi:hypothetical protein
MGGTNPQREADRARVAYFAAARRFTQAFAAMLAIGVPLDPGHTRQVREWSRADVEVLHELHEAIGQVLTTRRQWDLLRRHDHDRSH